MTKKKKYRFKAYHDYCITLGMNVRRLELPNETRVSGIFLMYESLLRSRKSLMLFCSNSNESNKYADLLLTENEWVQVAETYALLKVTNTLAMTSQKEGVNANTLSYYHVAMARNKIDIVTKLSVVDLNQTWLPDIDATKIPVISKELNELLPETNELINRFKKEFRHYFPQPDGDQVMMMVFNPLMVWSGFK
jgi:hypothetical protein